MAIGEVCSRVVTVLKSNDSVVTAAKLMREYHVGSLVVTRVHDGKNIPVGIFTDRDIAVGVAAFGLDPATMTVGDVIAEKVVCVREDAGVADVAAIMQQKGIRRLPVVNAGGELVGIVSADDLLMLLAEEMGALADMIAREQECEKQRRRPS